MKKTFIMAEEIKYESGAYFIKNGVMFLDTEERALSMALEHKEFLICVSDISKKQDDVSL